MKSGELVQFRIIWWVVLGALLVLAGLVFYLFEPRAAAEAEAGLWSGSSPAGYAAWILGGLGTLLSIAGARLARGVFLPGWRIAAKLAERAAARGGHLRRNPALGIYILGMAMIELTAFLGVLLYVRTGSFNAYIVLTGMALLGWLVARPEAPSPEEGGKSED